MSILLTINPYGQFFGLDGLPLQDGYVYIGVANQDPESFPIGLFYDAALTIPAPQPIRTVNGYISRNGSPAALYVNGNYSVRVRNSAFQQVFYIADFLVVGNSQPLSLAQLASVVAPSGASLIGLGDQMTPTIAALRLLLKTSASGYARVMGYYAQGDGGGGEYYYDSSDVTSVDNGGSIIVAADGGRWKLAGDGTYTVRQFGAKGDGATDDSVAFNKAILASKRTNVTPGTYKASNIDLPFGAELVLDGNATIIPASISLPIVKQHAGSILFGGIFDTTGIAFNATVIEFNGDDQVTNGFSLDTPTRCTTKVIGQQGINHGTAFFLHADGIATARIMGVEIRALILGMTFGVRMRQTSNDGSQFVNGNRIDAWCSSCWQALYMDTPSNITHLDGNVINIQNQTLVGTTAPAAYVAGQYNKFYIIPWDWASTVATSPYAITIAPGSQYNDISMFQSTSYLLNNSGNNLNTIDTLTNRYIERITNLTQAFYPAYPNKSLQTNAAIWGGAGAPVNGDGLNGDFYFNASGGAGTAIYQKRAGSWIGIV